MLKRCLLLLPLLALLLVGGASAAQTPSPYAIKVNVAANTVTIYTRNETGAYTVPYKAMICSTARPGLTTPLGSYTLQDGRYEWRLMLDGTYGQYATRFKGHFLFHSICYNDDRHDAMVREAYNNLGTGASMGCVRLQTGDAKWIYDNCPGGTPVTIYSDPNNPGPLGKPEKMVDYISEEGFNGWDPTDPADGNPWRNATAITLEPQTLTLTAGASAKLTAAITPETAAFSWKSSDETVAAIKEDGTVIALSAGTAEITACAQNGLAAVCTVQVEGELLPFDDLIPGAWYYPEVRQALQIGLFNGTGERTFEPETTLSRAMVVQVLYNLNGQPKLPKKAKSTFTDVEKGNWYHNAVVWAVSEGIVQGTSETTFTPDRSMTRQELAAVLWRYARKPAAGADLSLLSDGHLVQDYAREAMAWLVDANILRSSSLLPHAQVTRAETAAMFWRMIEQQTEE